MPREFVIQDLAQLEAIASPVRSRILSCLGAEGPLSASEIGHLIGRDPATLHYHLRRLIDVGLIEVREKRSIGPRSESVFAPIARVLAVDRSNPAPAYQAALQKAVRIGLRLVEREYETGLADPAYRTGPRREALIFVQQQVRLQRDDLRELRALLDRARRHGHDRHAPDRGQWVTVTMAVTPWVDAD